MLNGLRINMKKTKVMFNIYAKVKQIKVDDIIETTDRYIYLGQLVKTDNSHLEEVKRRTQTGWSAFGKCIDINMLICLKYRVFDQCILPSMTYGAETLAMTKKCNKNLEQHREAWKNVC